MKFQFAGTLLAAGLFVLGNQNGWAQPTSPEDVRPLEVGEVIPDAVLHTPAGQPVALRERVADAPAVLIFYRGGWCPYCTAHLSELVEIEDTLNERGFQVLAISPDRPEKLVIAVEDVAVGYSLLSDASMEVSQAFGLAFRVDRETIEQYKEYGIDLEAASGRDHHLLPIPAVYLVDTDGTIQYAYTNPDYRTRLDPSEILEAAQAMHDSK